MSECKFCHGGIIWKDENGRSVPYNQDGTKHRCQATQKPLSPATQPASSPTQQVTGLTDPAKIIKVSIGCTINLHDYNNLKVEVEATEADAAKKALIEILGVTIPAESAVSRECIDRYIRSVLAKKPEGQP